MQQGASLRRAYNMRTKCLKAMRVYLKRLGLDAAALAKIPTLHVTGSKGKGSTCAFLEAVLRAKGLRTVLFTSPHLVKVNERIRLDGKPLPDALWAKHFWAVWDRLHQDLPQTGNDDDCDDEQPDPLPGYFRLLTLLCLWVAVEEKADALILEVGVGGRYDATNVIPAPVACGITRLDLEHTEMLGDTIGKIAWEKGCIMKAEGGRVCFVGPQAPELAGEALPVLADCARQVQTRLWRVGPLAPEIELGMVGDFQRGNAAVAVALAQRLLLLTNGVEAVLEEGGGEEAEEELEMDVSGVVAGDPVMRAGLVQCSWPGRCQRVCWRGCRLLIDGAHTEQSMRAAVAWYDGQVKAASEAAGPPRCLVFHCGEEKSVAELLTHLVATAAGSPRFGLVAFCPVASARPTLASARPARELVLPPPCDDDDEEATGRASTRLAALCDALEAEEEGQGGPPPPPHQQQPLAWQEALRGAWRVLLAARLDGPADTPAAARALLARADAMTRTVVCPSVAAALGEMEALAAGLGDKVVPEVLVTGSLYLVGNTLGQVLEEDQQR